MAWNNQTLAGLDTFPFFLHHSRKQNPHVHRAGDQRHCPHAPVSQWPCPAQIQASWPCLLQELAPRNWTEVLLPAQGPGRLRLTLPD